MTNFYTDAVAFRTSLNGREIFVIAREFLCDPSVGVNQEYPEWIIALDVDGNLIDLEQNEREQLESEAVNKR